jgi:hypothetical protein
MADQLCIASNRSRLMAAKGAGRLAVLLLFSAVLVPPIVRFALITDRQMPWWAYASAGVLSLVLVYFCAAAIWCFRAGVMARGDRLCFDESSVRVVTADNITRNVFPKSQAQLLLQVGDGRLRLRTSKYLIILNEVRARDSQVVAAFLEHAWGIRKDIVSPVQEALRMVFRRRPYELPQVTLYGVNPV